jgi:hypothetical protein
MTHQSRLTYIVVVSSFVFMFVGALGQVEAQTKQTAPGVFKSPGVLAPKVTGFAVQGNQLKAMTGYVLEKGPNNQVMARRAGGGGLGAISATCGCSKAGSCDASSSGDVAVCSKSAGNPCLGACEWSFPALGGGGIKMQ